MIWFFERASEIAACEVRRTPTHFEIAIRRPDQGETVALAHTAAELLSQLETAPRALLQDGWRCRTSLYRPIL